MPSSRQRGIRILAMFASPSFAVRQGCGLVILVWLGGLNALPLRRSLAQTASIVRLPEPSLKTHRGILFETTFDNVPKIWTTH